MLVAVLFVAAQLLLWTAIPALVHDALPLDVVEGLAWGHEWQWGYDKHPPMPAWLLEAAHTLLGRAFLGPFLLSQLFVAGTYWFAWLLARDILGAPAATVALLLQSGVLYFTFLSPEFNHNVAQMPVWALAILLLWRSVATGRLRCWIALGLVLGAGVLTKYSIGVLAVVMLLYAVTGRDTRRLLAAPGPWAAALAGTLVALPHLLWLLRAGFAPLAYANAEFANAAGGSFIGDIGVGLGFLGAQAANHLPLFLLLAASGLIPWRHGAKTPPPAAPGWQGLPGETRRFLLWMGLGPVFLTAALALLGIGLRDMWGTPMFSLSGVLAVALLGRNQGRLRARRLLGAAGGLLVLSAAAYGLAVSVGPTITGHNKRANWPVQAIAAQLGQAWHDAMGEPPRIIAGPTWLAGNIALNLPDGSRPSVLIDGETRLSPWIGEESLARHGALVVWHEGRGQRYLERFPAMRPQPPVTVPWPTGVGEPLRIGWGILPPEPRAGQR